MNAVELVASLSEQFGDTRLVVVANREPYIHTQRVEHHNGLWARMRGRRETVTVDWQRPASGLVTALDPVMRACGGTWVAHGSGSGDRLVVDERGRVGVPPDRPSYTLRRVWLTPEEEEGYYYGFANNALWPLCHIAYARPEFNESDWRHYVEVNRRFADTVLEEVGDSDRAVVFVQDYHYALLPRFVKDARPDVVVCQFWHIPWPNPEAFRICPWGYEVLDGLLGNDLLAFHIQYHCNNFIETVDRTMEARTDREHFAIWRGGRRTFVKPFPISIDPDLWAGPTEEAARVNEVRKTRAMLDLRDERLIFGVDRLDYTKGIPDRLRAFDRMLERYPEWRGKVVMFQVGAPSRDHLARYQALSEEVDGMVQAINARHGTDYWKPVVYRREHHEQPEVAALYRAANMCIVSSLHDGMNLVAKEFIASRTDEQGVLVLSRFTGAARDLDESLLVNPYAIDEFADAIHEGLTMSPDQQAKRMRALRQRVQRHTVYDWAASLLSAAQRMSESV